MEIQVFSAGTGAGMVPAHRWRLMLVSLMLLLVVFSKSISRLPVEGATYLDEIAIVTCVVVFSAQRIVAGARLRTLPGLAFFAAFLLVGFVSGVVAGAGLGVVAMGGLLASKAILIAFAVAQLDWDDEAFEKLVRHTAMMSAIVMVGVVTNLAIPDQWASVFSSSGTSDIRWGVASPTSLFVHPGDLAVFAGVVSIGAVEYFARIKRTRVAVAIAVVAGLVALSTMRRKTWGSLASALLVSAERRARVRVLAAAAVALPLAIVFLWTPVSRSVSDTYGEYIDRWETSPRSAMTVGSFSVANDSFPLGAGLGRYGTFTAAQHYSPEYYRLGFDGIWGMLDEDGPGGQYLVDTQWPAVLGEGGWLGLAAFVTMMVSVMRFYGRFTADSEGQPSWVLFGARAGRSILVFCLVESIASPSFYAGPLVAFALLAAGILASRCDLVLSTGGEMATRLRNRSSGLKLRGRLNPGRSRNAD